MELRLIQPITNKHKTKLIYFDNRDSNHPGKLH